MGKKGKGKSGRYPLGVTRAYTGKSAGVALADIKKRNEDAVAHFRRDHKTEPVYRLDTNKNLPAYDFHGMTVKDAEAWLKKNMRGNRHDACVLITGRGNHSKQPVSPVKKQVVQFLEQQNLAFGHVSGGGALLVTGKKAFGKKVSARFRQQEKSSVSANPHATFVTAVPSSKLKPGISYSDMLKKNKCVKRRG